MIDMKYRWMHIFVLLAGVMIFYTRCTSQVMTYEPTWESLSRDEIPEWVLDAKFGVYTHWGVYSVPAHGGPDYVKNLYDISGEDKKGVIRYHENKYGPRSEIGYTQFIPQFKAEKFKADEWAGLMAEAGAKFGGICLVHHDGFLLWDSEFSRWNAKNMGPGRDIYGEIAEVVRKRGMKLAATFHHGRTFGYVIRSNMDKYSAHQKGTWEIFKPELSDFYWNPSTASVEDFARRWYGKITEVMDKYDPDFIWFDGLRGSINNGATPDSLVRKAFAYYYNKAEQAGKEVIIANKLPASRVFNFPEEFGLLCYENCRDMPEHQDNYWLADRAIGYPWSYVNDKVYKHRADYHVRSLIDMVSRGGIFFLSLTPMGNGAIHEEEQTIMRNIGKWLKANGEAIYNTRRWRVFGEGPAQLTEHHQVNGKDKIRWNFNKLSFRDVRFTRSKDKKYLYAIVLGWPEDRKTVIKALNSGEKIATEGIRNITLLDSDEEIRWDRGEEGLTIYFPEKRPNEITYAFRIEVGGQLID